MYKLGCSDLDQIRNGIFVHPRILKLIPLDNLFARMWETRGPIYYGARSKFCGV